MRNNINTLHDFLISMILATLIAPQLSAQSTMAENYCKKNAYERGAGTPPRQGKVCDAHHELDGMLCYNKCKNNYTGTGSMCSEKCPPRLPFDCGIHCSLDKKACFNDLPARLIAKKLTLERCSP